MPDDQPAVPDVDRLARSMLLLHGDHGTITTEATGPHRRHWFLV